MLSLSRHPELRYTPGVRAPQSKDPPLKHVIPSEERDLRFSFVVIPSEERDLRFSFVVIPCMTTLAVVKAQNSVDVSGGVKGAVFGVHLDP